MVTMQAVAGAIRRNVKQPMLTRAIRGARLLLGRWSFNTAVRRSRRRLADLTDAQLADIGISRHEAEQEARKVFF